MLVTPDTFRMHMETIQNHMPILPLSEWLQRREAGASVPANCCAVTFDDGWADNAQFAFPTLESMGIPATVFVVADMLGNKTPFWPNRVARLLTEGHAEELAAESKIEWSLPCASNPADDREAQAALIGRLKQLPDDTVEALLQTVENKHKIDYASNMLMSWEQLETAVKSGLIEAGSHTLTHRRLTRDLPPEETIYQIGESKKILCNRLNRDIPLFCYPNGDVSPLALKTVQKYYKGAVTTQSGINNVRTPVHQLARMGVHEDISDNAIDFLARVSGWL